MKLLPFGFGLKDHRRTSNEDWELSLGMHLFRAAERDYDPSRDSVTGKLPLGAGNPSVRGEVSGKVRETSYQRRSRDVSGGFIANFCELPFASRPARKSSEPIRLWKAQLKDRKQFARRLQAKRVKGMKEWRVSRAKEERAYKREKRREDYEVKKATRGRLLGMDDAADVAHLSCLAYLNSSQHQDFMITFGFLDSRANPDYASLVSKYEKLRRISRRRRRLLKRTRIPSPESRSAAGDEPSFEGGSQTLPDKTPGADEPSFEGGSQMHSGSASHVSSVQDEPSFEGGSQTALEPVVYHETRIESSGANHSSLQAVTRPMTFTFTNYRTRDFLLPMDRFLALPYNRRQVEFYYIANMQSQGYVIVNEEDNDADVVILRLGCLLPFTFDDVLAWWAVFTDGEGLISDVTDL